MRACTNDKLASAFADKDLTGAVVRRFYDPGKRKEIIELGCDGHTIERELNEGTMQEVVAAILSMTNEMKGRKRES